jgi:choline kinase
LEAIILAAGEGKRLRPLTNNTPKCLVNLFGKSLLQQQIETFRSCKIDDISVVTGHLNQMINFENITYFQNPNFKTTNMVETLFCAKEKLTNSVIVSYGDIIFEKNVLQKLIDSNDDISVVIDKNWKKYWEMRFDNPLNDIESLILDDGYISNIGQKVNSFDKIQGQYIGLMKFQNEGMSFLLDFYENAKKKSKDERVNILNSNLPFEKSYMTDLLQGLINAGCKIKAVPVNNGWLELDSYHDYEVYNKKYKDGTISDLISVNSD